MTRRVCEDFDLILNTVSFGDDSSRSKQLAPLTDTVPLPLLPLCNRPLISYQLDLILSESFTRILIVVIEQYKKRIDAFVQEYVRSKKSALSVSYLEVRGSLGDAAILHELALKTEDLCIKDDFIFIGCGVISGKVLQAAADVHRVSRPVVTMSFKEKVEDEKRASSQKHKKKQAIAKKKDPYKTKEYVGLVRSSSAEKSEGFDVRSRARVVYSRTKAALEKENKSPDGPVVEIPKVVMASHPRLVLYSDLEDSGVYFFSRWILDFLQQKSFFRSIKDDLLPYLVSRDGRTVSDGIPKMSLDLGPAELSRAVSSDSVVSAASLGSDTKRNSTSLRIANREMETMAVVHSFNGAFSGRVGSIPEYLGMNREIMVGRGPWDPIMRGIGKAKDTDTDAKKRWNALRKTFQTSVVASIPTVGEKAKMKIARSVIGNGVKLGKNVTLNNCVVMDDVEILDNCVIQNSVLCRGVKVKEGCKLDDCQIGEGFVVTKSLNGESRSSATAGVGGGLIHASPVLSGAFGGAL